MRLENFDFERRIMKKHVILMVDDVELNHMIAREVLKDSYELYEALSAAEGFEILERIVPDLILLDIVMPGMDGFEMLKLIKGNDLLKRIPVIFLTADASPEAEIEGFNCGIADYIVKPFVPTVMKKRIETQIALSEYEHSLEAKVTAKVEEIEKMYDLISVSFAGLVESRDGVTGGHLKNTAIYFKTFMDCLATHPKYYLQLTPEVVKKAVRSAPLHDVGKIAIEDAVLRKSCSLDPVEFDKMRQHTIIGGDIFAFIKERIADREFGEIAEHIARFHHERWDGEGYPLGLKGEEIPLVSRIMSIVDVYDALTSRRPYKSPFSHEKSMGLIIKDRGKRFDPDLVDEFVKISDKIQECLMAKEQILIKEQYFNFYNNNNNNNTL